MSIFRKKPFPKGEEETKLKRSLSTFDLISLGVGTIVGTGIFTVTGIGAKEWAGPALSLSFVIAAFAVMLSGLIFAEYASRIPAIGGPYAYMYTLFGEFMAWMSGWLIIVEFIFAGSLIATGWSGYFRGFLSGVGITLPQALSGALDFKSGTYVDLVAMLIVLLVTFLVAHDAKKVLRFNSLMVGLKLFVIVLFIVLGAFFIKTENWHPYMPYGFFGKNGKGVMAGAALMFFAYLGFETISMTVEEAKTPKKTVPRGILGSILVTTSLYVLVTVVLTGMVPFQKLGVSDPVAYAMRLAHMPLVASTISVVAVVALLTGMISMSYSISRLIYAISKDGLLPQFLSKVESKHHIPKNATFVTGFFAIIFSGLIPLATLAQMINIVTLTYLIFMAVGIFRLRKINTQATESVFLTPFVPVLPIVSIAISLYLMFQLSTQTWIAFGIVLVSGIVIYFSYGYKHSAWSENEHEVKNEKLK